MIDRTYAERLYGTVLDSVLKRSLELYYSRFNAEKLVSDFEKKRDSIIGEVICKLWDQLMTNCKAYESGTPLLVSEKALACLVRRGVNDANLRMKQCNAWVTLSHLTYYVEKEGVGCSAGPCVPSSHWGHLPFRWIGLRGEDFADFMFEFDELVPSIVKAVDGRLLEYRVKGMQYEIICQTLDQLGEQFLKPFGIRWSLASNFTDTNIPVTFSDRTHKSFTENIPTTALAETLRGIPERMAGQPNARL